MPRVARIVALDLPHHITQRGNYQLNVFTEDKDRKQYLTWFQEYCEKYKVSVLSYCLMRNHVHFIAIPHTENSFAGLFNAVSMRYSQYFNKKQGVSGHLWQSRFYSCVLDEPHLIMAARYVERNPVRANIVKNPWDWRWSCASYYVNGGNSIIKLKNLLRFIDVSAEQWKKYIDLKEEEKQLNDIRQQTLKGRPLAVKIFIDDLEKKLGRKLVAEPRGRPKKEK